MPFTLKATFLALRHPNYRLWFMGQLVSLVGSWMQTTAQGYLVYQLTGSSAYLGYVGFASGLPVWLFTLYGGVIADRMPRRTLLVITQATMMIPAFLLAWLVLSETIQAWMIIVMAFFLGIANAFDAPARQSFVVELVGQEDLTNAIALNSTMFNMATIVGPAVAGMIYAWLGPGWCFTINGLSFVAVIAALLMMKLKPFIRQPRKESTLTQLKEGFRFAAAEETIRILIVNLAFISLFAFGLVTLIPAWAVKILHGDVTTNGLLLSARGVGALIGALTIAALGRYRVKGKLLTIGGICLPLALAAFSLARWLPLSVITLVLFGLCFMFVANVSNALVQTHVTDELRGRVMGIYTLTFFGFQPLGSLMAGTLASGIGETNAVLVSASVLLALALFIWFGIPHLRELS
jgi:MFS family permease